jgi:hypothetical protein
MICDFRGEGSKMAVSCRRTGSYGIQPNVRFDGYDGLVLFDDWAEHWIFIPTLKVMLRSYLESPKSRPKVREWINQTGAAGSPSEFARLCDNLDLAVDYVRAGLIRWMDNVDSHPDCGGHQRQQIRNLKNRRSCESRRLLSSPKSARISL